MEPEQVPGSARLGPVDAQARRGPDRVENPASPAFRKVWSHLLRLARHDHLTITLEGESGTGKTTIARRVHELSPRSKRPFVEVDLGALDDQIAGSELFGHVPGAFTGATSHRTGLVASANGGTLFLDEIGKASKTVQQRLLTLMERRMVRPLGSDREIAYDPRFIVATNIPLEDLAASDRILPDLVPRLSVFRVRIPPLRERREDLPLLVQALLDKHAALFGYNTAPTLSDDLAEAIAACEWRHNIRATVINLQSPRPRNLQQSGIRNEKAHSRSSSTARLQRWW